MTPAEWMQLVVVALTTGGSAYLSVRAALIQMKTDLKYIRRDVDRAHTRLDRHGELITDIQRRVPESP
mgnify:CR=1 FL=1